MTTLSLAMASSTFWLPALVIFVACLAAAVKADNDDDEGGMWG